MSTDEQEGRAGGSVPHAYRNALFWRWVPAMPGSLPSGFVALLYALGSAADPSGRLKFRDGKAIRVTQIAAAVRADEKDVRRYLDAAISAGVLALEGERRRGRVALYVLIVSPDPDWGAAVSSLTATKRKRVGRSVPPWRDAKFGGPPPKVAGAKFGGPPPELSEGPGEKVRGTAPHWSSGDRPPLSSGDRPPNIPGVSMEVPHEMAEVVGQPQVEGGPDPQTIHPGHDKPPRHVTDAPDGFTRCSTCHRPMVPRPGRTTHAHCAADTPVQPPLLFGVPNDPHQTRDTA